MRRSLLGVSVVGVALGLATITAACRTDEGREMRPPPPSATTAPTTAGSGAGTAPVSGDASGTFADDGGLTLSLPFKEKMGRRYSCDGAGLAPQISWLDVPAGTQQLALVVRDPDAGGFVHWVVASLDPATGSFLPDAPGGPFVEAVNSAGKVGWAPACPPPGDGAHRYEFTLYAIAEPFEIAADSPAADAIEAIEAAAASRTTVIATYERA